MSLSQTRLASLRRSWNLASRRWASNAPQSSNATEKATEAAAKASKAAQDAALRAQELASKYAGGIGAKVDHYVGAYRGPVSYNFQVFLQLLKQVYKTEKLSPPSVAEVTSAYQTLFQRAQNAAYWKDIWASGEWKKVAIGAVEVYGIFKIGEIIGRRSLIGYSLD